MFCILSKNKNGTETAIAYFDTYENIDELIAEARKSFFDAMTDLTKDPWNRYSAAVGMSIWQKDDDFDTVFRRADKLMYDEKSKIKDKYTVA